MDPRLRELAALSGLAAVGCGFHASMTLPCGTRRERKLVSQPPTTEGRCR